MELLTDGNEDDGGDVIGGCCRLQVVLPHNIFIMAY